MRSPVRILALACFLLTALFATASMAQDKQDKKVEKEARDLQKKAIEEDNLATDYENAVKRLESAVSKCGDGKCGDPLRATLFRDLGAMQILNREKKDGLKSFAEALKLDPKLHLDASYKNAELEQFWEQVKKSLKPADEPKEPKTPKPGAPPSTGPTDSPAGDFKHTPVSGGIIRTPFPIYVEYDGDEEVVKVVAKYKGYGMTEYKTLPLQKVDKGWGAYVPCHDVTEGTMRYFIQGFSPANEPVATLGERNKPVKLQIAKQSEEEAPALPGQDAPKQCKEKGECPPDFPGCKGDDTGTDPNAGKKDEGEYCEEDVQCKSSACRNERCTAPNSDGKKQKFARLWIGLSGSLDYSLVPSSEDVCKLDQSGGSLNSAGYYCISGDKDYPGRADTDPKGEENARIGRPQTRNKVQGGAALGNIRLMASLDYAVNTNFLIGGRLGWSFITYPGTAAKDDGKMLPAAIHLEARATYVIGKDPLMKAGFAPIVFGGLGMSESTTRVDVNVNETDKTDATKTNVKDAQAWLIGGPVFFTIGGGGRYAFNPKAALVGALKFNGALAGAAGFVPSFAPEVGVQFGF